MSDTDRSIRTTRVPFANIGFSMLRGRAFKFQIRKPNIGEPKIPKSMTKFLDRSGGEFPTLPIPPIPYEKYLLIIAHILHVSMYHPKFVVIWQPALSLSLWLHSKANVEMSLWIQFWLPPRLYVNLTRRMFGYIRRKTDECEMNQLFRGWIEYSWPFNPFYVNPKILRISCFSKCSPGGFPIFEWRAHLGYFDYFHGNWSWRKRKGTILYHTGLILCFQFP